jgi:hypothetical protein
MKRSRCLTCFVRGSARGIGPGATEESVVLVVQEDALDTKSQKEHQNSIISGKGPGRCAERTL